MDTADHFNKLTQIPGTALLEFQIPQQVARYASFMFSFLGRGICKQGLMLMSQRALTGL